MTEETTMSNYGDGYQDALADAAGFPLAAKINRPNSARNYEIRVHRTELIPGGNGALLGFSDDHPDRQFLIIPEGEE
jgi:hypothetical protein